MSCASREGVGKEFRVDVWNRVACWTPRGPVQQVVGGSLCVMFRAVGRSQPRLPGAWNYSLSDNSQQCPLPFTLATHIAHNGRWRPTRPALALAVSKIFSFDQELHPHLLHVTGNLCTATVTESSHHDADFTVLEDDGWTEG